MSMMQLGPIITLPAGQDLSASFFCGVDINSSGQAVLPSAGGAIVGVTTDKSLNGASCPIQVAGIAQMILGGTVAKGDKVKVDASGRAVTASAADVAAGSVIGRCVIGGATAGTGSILLDVFGVGTVSTTGDETVTTGALSAATLTSYLSVTGTQPYTLPNGTFNGQRKRIECSVAASTPVGTLTITTPFTSEQATYGFDTVGQGIELEWRAATGWHIVGKKRAGKKTFTVGTNNVGADDLHVQIDLSVTGTVSSSFAAGNVPGEAVHITTSTAASIPSGTLTTTAAKSKVGTITSTGLNTINATTAFAWLYWDGAFWHEVNSATLAFA